MTSVQLDNLRVEVAYKNIKNLYLRVYLSSGKVTISAPLHTELNIIRDFVISKLSWINKQQQKFKTQEQQPVRKFFEGESHYYNGKPYKLQLVKQTGKTKVAIGQEYLTLCMPHDYSIDKCQSMLNTWYRQQLKQRIPVLISRYEKIMDVQVAEFGIKRMKTRWGTCNPAKRRIWLNLELAKKSPECLEYVVVHEMVHLLEASHNKRFVAFMDLFMPDWRLHKNKLNRFSISHTS
jgi:predicted metal-dependent hydrolase